MSKELKSAIFISISVHAILALIALFIQFRILPSNMFKKIELIEFGLPETSTNEKYISSPSSASNRTSPDLIGRKSNLIPKKVELPHAISQDDQTVYVPQDVQQSYNKLDWNEQLGVQESPQDNNLSSENIIADQQDSDNPLIASDDNYLQTLTNSLLDNSGKESSYILEGDVSNRKIIKKVIPPYPEDVQKNSEVKIRFEVLKDGSVTDMIVVKKADPVLEEISLQALEKWKFNALRQDIVQIGTITFIYELK